MDAHSAWIAFSETPPREALDKLDEFLDSHRGISVEVRADWGYSEADLQRAIETVHYTLLNHPGVIDVVTSHDYATNQITATIVDAANSSISLDAFRETALSAIVDAGLGHLVEHVDVHVRRSPLPFWGGMTARRSTLAERASAVFAPPGSQYEVLAGPP